MLLVILAKIRIDRHFPAITYYFEAAAFAGVYIYNIAIGDNLLTLSRAIYIYNII